MPIPGPSSIRTSSTEKPGPVNTLKCTLPDRHPPVQRALESAMNFAAKPVRVQQWRHRRRQSERSAQHARQNPRVPAIASWVQVRSSRFRGAGLCSPAADTLPAESMSARIPGSSTSTYAVWGRYARITSRACALTGSASSSSITWREMQTGMAVLARMSRQRHGSPQLLVNALGRLATVPGRIAG